MIANPGLPRLRWLSLAVALLALSAGCEEDSVPQITQFEAEPSCDIITSHDDGDYLEVRFFARASGGNGKSDPTGANSPLDWNWEFGDGAGAGNIVNPVHRYTEPGEYTIRLTVTDDDGDTDEQTVRIFVGQRYSDLDVLSVEATTTGVPRIAFAREDTLNVFQGWTSSFRGSLNTPCPIEGIFQNYLWRWDYGDGAVDLHLGEPMHLFPPIASNFDVFLTVTENNTQVARTDTTSTSHPSGMRLSNPTRIVLPEQRIGLALDGLLMVGVNRVETALSWPDTFEVTASATATPEILAEGFQLQTDTSTPGRMNLEFTAPTALTRDDSVLTMASVFFTRTDGDQRVLPGLVTVAMDTVAVELGSGGARPSNGIGGEFDVDNDCNDNDTPDRFEDDCNANGFVDECDIALGKSQDCNNNDIPDDCDISRRESEDCNNNEIPDECDVASGTSVDCNNNGVPDECEPDCNENGIADSCDIRDETSEDCDGNGVPDECQPDCNENGIMDICEVDDGLALDCNDNDIPDECEVDCNENGIPDDCDIDSDFSVDCNNNGRPDECEPDCNDNGVADFCDIRDGTSDDLNRNGIPDECE